MLFPISVICLATQLHTIATGNMTPCFRKVDGKILAIRCEKRAFLFTDGKIKLPVAMANVRETVLSAPRVVLNNYDIIESPHPATGYRKIYAKLDEIDVDGSVLLRTLDYYVRVSSMRLR